MRTVLLLAYQFPPIGGAGVLRAVKLAQYLPEHGYRPIVVTGYGRPEFAWTPEDRGLLDGLKEVRVERIPTPEPPLPSRGRRTVERALDSWSAVDRWWVTGAERIGRAMGARSDVILCELGPYETADAAVQLANDLAVPWVADLQDPWALDEMWVYPTQWHLNRDRERMCRVLSTAAGIIMNTPEAAARVARTWPEMSGKLDAIPNGYDPADFATRVEPRRDGLFRIVHTGTLHTAFAMRERRAAGRRRRLGGMPVPGVEFLTRSHVYLLRAIDGLLARRRELQGTVELHLAGALTDDDRMVCAGSSVRVVEHSFVSHSESVKLMRTADLLFLPMQKLPDDVRAGLVPTKTYEYLASGARILAAVPPGDARDLLSRVEGVSVVEPDDVGGMTVAIEEAINFGSEERARFVRSAELLGALAWPGIVERIAGRLDAAVARP